MFRNLFSILFRPQVTLDRLLEERKYGQSWAATWFLVGINVLLAFLLGIFFAREINDIMNLLPTGEDLPEQVVWVIMGVVMVFSLIGLPIYYVLSRFFFAWIVQLGVRISASAQYPRDGEERQEKAALLRLIQPYTLWIYTVVGVVTAAIMPFFMNFSNLIEMAIMNPEMFETGEEPPAEMFRWMFGMFAWSTITNLLQLGLMIYMIVVRTIAIKKIYNISGSQAFWGPFLIYFLLYFGLFILFVVFALINTILTGGAGTEIY